MSALVVDGHPNPSSLTAAIAAAYARGYGASARTLVLRDLDFNVHMRFGYRERMPLERDLADAKQAMSDASRIIVVTPMWWGSVPALLKGFFDRALLPQEEYRYSRGGLPVGMLAGRRGRLFLLADTPWYAAPFTGLPAVVHVARNTLRFVGLRPTRVHRMLGVKLASDAQRARWIAQAEARGAADARTDATSPAPTPSGFRSESATVGA